MGRMALVFANPLFFTFFFLAFERQALTLPTKKENPFAALRKELNEA